MITINTRPSKAGQFQTHLFQGASILALTAALQVAGPASAQQGQQAQAANIEEIVVTGSRVAANGLESPTPVTVVGIEQLKNAAPGDINAALNFMPQFLGSTTSQAIPNRTTGARQGATYLNLRNLGRVHTLVLVDGHRLVPQGSDPNSDSSLIPQQLVSRVDVVTGGASAVYGSDAVAGVVNFVTDATFEGVKGEAQAGIAERGYKEHGKADIAYGTSLHGGQGHIMVSASYLRDAGLCSCETPAYKDQWAVISNPAVTAATATVGNPLRVTVPNVLPSNASYGGLITTAGILKGVQFGPGGVPGPFIYGNYVSATTMSGGGNGPNPQTVDSIAPQLEENAYVNLTYDLTDNITAYAQGFFAYGDYSFTTQSAFEFAGTQFTIFSGNPYLPASIQAIMTAKNIASFTMGRLSNDFGPEPFEVDNRSRTFIGGFKGKIADSWNYDVFYNYGSNKSHGDNTNTAIQRNLYRASDAVRDPATGNIVCNTRLQNPTSTVPEIANCEPINLFGEGSPSSAALGYIMGHSTSQSLTKQNNAAISVNGQPFSIWAGPVTFAFGGEWRKDSVVVTNDPISGSQITNTDIINGVAVPLRAMPASLNQKIGGFERTNTQAINGSFTVKEAFAEVGIPLAQDVAMAKSLNFDGAVRFADYSSGGGVWAWKAGLVYEPLENIRLRATRSRDIRAGSNGELFLSTFPAQGAVTDPFRNRISSQTINQRLGNPNLKPERADTTTAGITVQPDWLPGFGASIDWWQIKIKDAITSLGSQTIVDQCFLGVQNLCSLIQRGAPLPGETIGPLFLVNSPTINAASNDANGWDFEVSYRMQADEIVSDWDGTFNIRAVAGYLGKLQTIVLGNVPSDAAGSIASSPHWKGNLALTYDNATFGFYVQERYVGGGIFDNTPGVRDGIDIDKNYIGSKMYTDITAHYRFGEDTMYDFYLTVNNLWDTQPPKTGRINNNGTTMVSDSLHDIVGRAYTGGVRFKF